MSLQVCGRSSAQLCPQVAGCQRPEHCSIQLAEVPPFDQGVQVRHQRRYIEIVAMRGPCVFQLPDHVFGRCFRCGAAVHHHSVSLPGGRRRPWRTHTRRRRPQTVRCGHGRACLAKAVTEAERKKANVVVITEEFSVSTAASPDAGRIPEGTDPAGRADAGTCWGERLIAAVADDRGDSRAAARIRTSPVPCPAGRITPLRVTSSSACSGTYGSTSRGTYP